MRKSFLKIFSIILIILVTLIAISVVSYSYISDVIVTNNVGDNLTSILNSTTYTIDQKFDTDYEYYGNLVEEITKDSDSKEKKYTALVNNISNFPSLANVDSGFAYRTTYKDGSDCVYIDGVLYRDNNSTFIGDYFNEEISFINFGRDCNTINDVESKFDVKDYVLYRFGDLFLYIDANQYLANIFNDSESIEFENYYIMFNDGKICYQKDVNDITIFYERLRRENNSDTIVNGISKDFSSVGFSKKVYNDVTYNGKSCHLLTSVIDTEEIDTNLIICLVISTDAARYPINQIVVPLIATFVIITIFVCGAIVLAYVLIDRKNNDINQMINSRINEKVYVIKVNNNGKIISLNDELTKLLVDPKKYDLLSSFNFKETYTNIIGAINTKKRFTVVIPSEECTLGVDVVIGFVTLKRFNKLLLVGNDITEHDNKYNEYRDLALTDKVTTLQNREVFIEGIGKAITKVKDPSNIHKVSLLGIEVFNYKNFISFYGIKIGNAIKQKVSDVLTEILAEEKVEIYYLEETVFGVIFDELTDYNDVLKIVQRIQEYFDRPIIVSTNSLRMMIKCGIYNLDLDTYKTEEPVLIYEKLLKLLQKINNYSLTNVETYNMSVERYFSNEEILESDLKHALDNKEFIMYLQPQYDLDDSRICGFEMLIRWDHPKYFHESPLHFISVAELNGMIVHIGNFVIEETMRIAKELEKYDICLSMNVSPVQLLQTGFVNEVIEIADKYEVKYNRIALEITETYLMENFQLVNDKLIALKTKGFRIHLDDFGTGYSSMLYLKELPIDTIKIDKEFIKFVETDKYSRAICNKIISLGKMLELDIIAEGVETEKQRQYCIKNGCNIIQGFYLSKAVPLEKAIELLEGHNVKKTMTLELEDKSKKKSKKLIKFEDD